MKTRWYIIQVYSGAEQKVVKAIQEHAARAGLQDAVEECLVPTEEVTQIRKGEKKQVERTFFPGYILVKMNLTDDLWQLIRALPNVSQFLGAGGKPCPVSQKEVDKIMKQLEEGVALPESTVSYEVGEQIKVCEGPFENFNGVVEEVDAVKSRLKVSVSIFGRSTPVDLEYNQVEKI